MNKDVRIQASLPSHPKTKKLVRALGPGGGWFLVRLFLWVAVNRPDGDLNGLSDDDLELAIDWPNEPGAFIAHLAGVGFVDGGECTRRIHDWEEHNPWAAGAADRAHASRYAALCKRYGSEEATRRMQDRATRREAPSDSHAECTRAECEPHAPLPSPSPLPSPEEESPDGDLSTTTVVADRRPAQRDRCPQQDIVDLYHDVLPELRQVRDWTAQRQKLLRGRWREDKKRQDLDWWRELFAYVRSCDFLMGRSPGRNGEAPFEADLEWIVRPRNLVKIIEGKYENRAVA
jgi:hypothetical protein